MEDKNKTATQNEENAIEEEERLEAERKNAQLQLLSNKEVFSDNVRFLGSLPLSTSRVKQLTSRSLRIWFQQSSILSKILLRSESTSRMTS